MIKASCDRCGVEGDVDKLLVVGGPRTVKPGELATLLLPVRVRREGRVALDNVEVCASCLLQLAEWWGRKPSC